MATLAQNIETLFAQIGSFETGSREYSTGAFVSNLNGILSALQMLPNQPEQSAAVDEILYRKVREAEPSQSLLRFTATNILAMYLYARASGSLRHVRSYEELVRSRPESAASDGDFIERVLVPRLLVLRGLGGDAVLGTHLLLKLADYLLTFGAPATFAQSASPSELARRGLPTLLLGFARRRLEFAGRLLREDPGALEYGLKRDRFFEWMSVQGRQQGLDVEPYLGQLQLLSASPWWRRLLNAVGQFLSNLGLRLRSGFEWLPAGGVFWSGFWILVAIVVMVCVPTFWFLHYEDRLREFKGEGMHLATKRVEVLPKSAEETP